METEKVEFASDEYFALLESNADLTEAFALGGQVIAIRDGMAYEVTSEAYRKFSSATPTEGDGPGIAPGPPIVFLCHRPG